LTQLFPETGQGYQHVELIVEFYIGCGDKTQKWEPTWLFHVFYVDCMNLDTVTALYTQVRTYLYP